MGWVVLFVDLVVSVFICNINVWYVLVDGEYVCCCVECVEVVVVFGVVSLCVVIFDGLVMLWLVIEFGGGDIFCCCVCYVIMENVCMLVVVEYF